MRGAAQHCAKVRISRAREGGSGSAAKVVVGRVENADVPEWDGMDWDGAKLLVSELADDRALSGAEV